MIAKVRDRGTFIPVLAVSLIANTASEEEFKAMQYLLGRVGYVDRMHPTVPPSILLTRLSGDGTPSWSDPHGWVDRTFVVAHKHIGENWASLRSGDVVDVEHILGETGTKKLSERLTT